MKKILPVLFVVLSLLFLSIPTKAASTNYIRVGLVTNYSEQDNLTISTKKIYMGYCQNNSYDEESGIHLTSTNGFSFSLQTGYFYVSQKSFSRYEIPAEICACLRDAGIPAYPAMTGKNEWKVYVGGSDDKKKVTSLFEQVDKRFGLTFGKLQKNNHSRYLLTGSDDTFLVDGKACSMYPQIVSEERNKNKIKTIHLGGSEYRGRIEIGCYKGDDTLTAVNIISVEQYLYGTVPNQINVIWSSEVLKAQAIITRNNTVYRASFLIDSDIDTGYTLTDNYYGQVYSGYSKENEYTTDAINETKNKFAFYNGKLIFLPFCENNGGYEESSFRAWHIKTGYLKPKADEYTSPSTWKVEYTKEQLQKKLEQTYPNIGEITKVEVLSTTKKSNRVSSLRLVGEEQTLILQHDVVYSLLGLNSSLFEVTCQSEQDDSNRIFVFTGKGSGSGVGLSMDGAKKMADAGMGYEEILHYYYKDIEIH